MRKTRDDKRKKHLDEMNDILKICVERGINRIRIWRLFHSHAINWSVEPFKTPTGQLNYMRHIMGVRKLKNLLLKEGSILDGIAIATSPNCIDFETELSIDQFDSDGDFFEPEDENDD